MPGLEITSSRASDWGPASPCWRPCFPIALVATAPPGKAGAQLNEPTISTPQLLSNPDFSQGTSDWSLTSGGFWATYQGSTIEGSSYLETNTGNAGPGASVFYQDVSMSTGYQATAARAGCLLRSPSGGSASLTLALFAIYGTSPNLVGVTNITVSSTSWQRYSVDMDVTASGYTALRFQLYVNTTGLNVDLDGTMVQDAGLANAGALNRAQRTRSLRPAAPGQRIATRRMSRPASSSGTPGHAGWGRPLPGCGRRSPPSGDNYQGALMMRSPSGAPVSALVALFRHLRVFTQRGGRRIGDTSPQPPGSDSA